MPTLDILQRVQPPRWLDAVCHAVSYRGQFNRVWIVHDSRHDALCVCRELKGGPVTAPVVKEVIEFSHFAGDFAEPYFAVTVGPGILPERERMPCQKRKTD